ncbi:MAG: hypothetical protein LBH53_01040, partial [Puniceicoccales bacterium]|nr:hypothetical protein [Puniceicoccales bacterium]
KDTDRGNSDVKLRSNVLHLGGCLAHRLLPIGPLALGVDLTVFYSQIATKASKNDTVSTPNGSFGKDFDSVRNWRAIPGVFVAFQGPGHVGCRAGGRWVWDMGKRPTFPRLAPNGLDDAEFVDKWNDWLVSKTGPKSGYGEVELAISANSSHGFFGELDAVACYRRNVGRLSLTVGRDF